MRSGRTAEGLTLLERAAGHAEALGFSYSHALFLGMLGEGRLLTGDLAGAAQHAPAAQELARRYGQRGWEARALWLRADVAAHADPGGPVERCFAEAAALASALGMRPLLAHCRLGLGRAHAQAGHKQAAQIELAAALAEYRAMQMPAWIALAEGVAGDLA